MIKSGGNRKKGGIMIKITRWTEIKHITLVVVMIAGMMSAVVAAPGNLQKIFDDAKAAYNAGEYEKAAIGFRKVLKFQPGYVYARKYLSQTTAKIKSGTKNTVSLEDKLAKMQVTSVVFEDASLGMVMEYLSQKSAEISGGKVVANIIYKGPREDKEKKMVTLKLSNVPMTEVIRYVGQLTGIRFKYEEYAIVGVPLAVAAKEAAVARELAAKKIAAEAKPKFDDKPKNPFDK